MADWSAGEYELTAQRLMPAAEAAVTALAPQPHPTSSTRSPGDTAAVAASSTAHGSSVRS